MSGGSGNTGANTSNQITQYANWFNDLNKQQGQALSGLAQQLPQINSEVLGGGTAPMANGIGSGVWNGGATMQQPVQRLTSINPYEGMGQSMNAGNIAGGLNNLPTGNL